jgi:hypothetical protein
MRYINTYEDWRPNFGDEIVERKVYWIIPFFDNRFEDALVKLHKDYTEWKTPIKPINDALELAHFFKKILKPKDKYVCVSMEYSINELTEKVVKGPIFRGWLYEDTKELEKDGYRYIGRVNIPDYEWSAFKYNL